MAETPAWKADFPIDWAVDHVVTRREFTRSLAWTSCASFVATAGLALGAVGARDRRFPQMRVAAAGEVPVGGAKVFVYPDDEPCVLLRLDADVFVAFVQRCTHLGCPVTYEASRQTLDCPCHEASFRADDGTVRAGPPRRPLPRVVLQRRGEELWAVGVRP
jgi:Rieske Fe-S protein